MYKAIKNFNLNGQKFAIGDVVPAELIEDRLIRAKKVVLVSKETAKAQELIIETVEVQEQEILTEDSSDVEVKVAEEEIKPSKKFKK